MYLYKQLKIMEKSKLDRFIRKYNLGGLIESVRIKSDSTDNSLVTKFISEEKHVLGIVKLKKADFGDMELGVYETSKLKNLLKVVGNEIDVTSVKTGDMVASLGFSDKNSRINFMLSDLSVIPSAPNLKQTPDWDVVVKLDKDLMNRFTNAKSALSDVSTFTLLMNKSNSMELVIGYSSINSNRISLQVECEPGLDSVNKPISFNANYFKEILSANSDAIDSSLKVSTKGLAYIEFKSDDYTAEYYLTEVPLG